VALSVKGKRSWPFPAAVEAPEGSPMSDGGVGSTRRSAASSPPSDCSDAGDREAHVHSHELAEVDGAVVCTGRICRAALTTASDVPNVTRSRT
jgi:hypothetical protein